MSRFKTLLSKRSLGPFNFEALSERDKYDIEKSIEFIPARRLDAVLRRIGQDKLVHLSGRSWKQVSRYLKGDRIPTEVLQAIADDTGATIDWLAQGKLHSPADVRFEVELLHAEIGARLVRLNHPRPEPEQSRMGYGLKLLYDRLDALDDFVPAETTVARQIPSRDPDMELREFIRLPFYNEICASAGPGAMAVSEQPDGVIAFARTFLRDKGATPDRCAIITARGDSMAPTIPDGSLLIVDHSQTQISNGYIMVINLGDDLLVKRVRRRLDGMVDLISDNNAYATETVGPDMLQHLRVVGRIVYFCRTP